MNTASQFDEQQHPGAVKSRTHSTCLVGEPVTVTLNGLATNLTIADAIALKEGLAVAIERVQAAESILKGDGETYNLCVLAPTRSGMSMPRSKLGDGRAVVNLFAEGHIARLKEIYAGVDPDLILSNTSTRIFLPTQHDGADYASMSLTDAEIEQIKVPVQAKQPGTPNS